MTIREIRSLKIGDRVRWAEDDTLGTIIEAGYCAVKIRWDDDQIANLQFNEHAHLIEKS